MTSSSLSDDDTMMGIFFGTRESRGGPGGPGRGLREGLGGKLAKPLRSKGDTYYNHKIDEIESKTC